MFRLGNVDYNDMQGASQAPTGNFQGNDYWEVNKPGSTGNKSRIYGLKQTAYGGFAGWSGGTEAQGGTSFSTGPGSYDDFFSPNPTPPPPAAAPTGGGAPPALQQLAQQSQPGPTAAGLNEGGMTPIEMGLGMRMPPAGGSALAQLAAKKGRIY